MFFFVPLEQFYCIIVLGVCQEVSQTFYTNYYPDLTDKVSLACSTFRINPNELTRPLTFAFNVWLYNVVYYVFFLYFLEVARPRISWATPS